MNIIPEIHIIANTKSIFLPIAALLFLSYVISCILSLRNSIGLSIFKTLAILSNTISPSMTMYYPTTIPFSTLLWPTLKPFKLFPRLKVLIIIFARKMIKENSFSVEVMLLICDVE